MVFYFLFKPRCKIEVLIERFNTHIELFNRMHAIRYRFMAQFGTDAGKPFDDFRRILNKMQVSAQALASAWAEKYRYLRPDREGNEHLKFIKEQENIFWEGLPEEDTIKPKVEKCIDDIEKICRPIIDNRSVFTSIIGSEFVKSIKESIANKLLQRSAKSRAR
jgi:hypothetical protein